MSSHGHEDQKESHAVALPVNVKVLKAVSLLAVGAALCPGAKAAETYEIRENRGESEAGTWPEQGWIVLLAGLVCLLRFARELGWRMIKRLLSKEESLKVVRLNDQASLPVRGSQDAAGWDLASSVQVTIQPGERRLVPLGLSLEIPSGCYGRIAPRSSMALRGVDIAGGVVDADYRGEVEIILVNHGPETFTVNLGDRVGQLIWKGLLNCSSQAGTRVFAFVNCEGSGGFWQRQSGLYVLSLVFWNKL